jgi:hypothetical protein
MFYELPGFEILLEQPLYGIPWSLVTLEYDNTRQLFSNISEHPISGKIEGKTLTLDIGDGGKIVGQLSVDMGYEELKGIGKWDLN